MAELVISHEQIELMSGTEVLTHEPSTEPRNERQLVNRFIQRFLNPDVKSTQWFIKKKRIGHRNGVNYGK